MPHKDPSKAKEYWQKYRESNRQNARERTAAWRQANPGKNAENARKWRNANPEKAAQKVLSYRMKNKEKVRARAKKWRDRVGYSKSPKRIAQSLKDWLKRYGLTPEAYDQILAEQNGCCAICGSTSPRMKNAKRLYVDHCHETGKTRSLLCFRCNSLLGFADESPVRLRLAANYLESHANNSGAICRD